MKLEPGKKNKIPYSIVVTLQFVVYMSRKEEDDGDEIPEDVIKEGVLKAIENKEYDVQEDSCQ